MVSMSKARPMVILRRLMYREDMKNASESIKMEPTVLMRRLDMISEQKEQRILVIVLLLRYGLIEGCQIRTNDCDDANDYC